jgi:hypothetical protein
LTWTVRCFKLSYGRGIQARSKKEYAMTGQFVVTRGGRDSFCTEEELRGLAAKGQLAPGDLVYHPVLGRWLYAREVEEVREQVEASLVLGRPVETPVSVMSNNEAVAGFVFSILAWLPLLNFVFCLLGIYFSHRGIRRAASLEHAGYGLAVAGLVLSIIALLPATACATMLLVAAAS